MEKTLGDKLGIKKGYKLYVQNFHGNYLRLVQVDRKDVNLFKYLTTINLDFIHLFCMTRLEVETGILEHKKNINKNGMIWISWPKKSAGLNVDVDENFIRKTALEIGLVDVKVCSVDPVWSALKLVYRKSDR